MPSTELRILSAVSGGGNPGPESSILKLNTTRLEQAINELSVDIIGYRGLVHNPVKKGECLSCHKPHASNHAGLLNERASDICFNCHTGIPTGLLTLTSM